jgi:membrane protein implicated in regulation of membrane protease activity
VAGVALLGVGILAALLALYLQPPAWLQITVGILLALGGVLLAWLVATAVGRSELNRSPQGERRPPSE